MTNTKGSDPAFPVPAVTDAMVRAALKAFWEPNKMRENYRYQSEPNMRRALEAALRVAAREQK